MMERVLGHLMDNPQGQRSASLASFSTRTLPHVLILLFAVAEIVKPLGLPQAKVNKCLIALVGKKAVTKTAVGVSRVAYCL